MKIPKNFVKHVAINNAGVILHTIVLTPPLDSEEAVTYRNWYHSDGNQLRRTVENDIKNSFKTEAHITHAIVAFETTLYK